MQALQVSKNKSCRAFSARRFYSCWLATAFFYFSRVAKNNCSVVVYSSVATLEKNTIKNPLF